MLLGLTGPCGCGQRRTTHNKHVPGPKTGDLPYLAEVKLFQRSKIPPYVAISLDKKAQHMVVDFQKSGLQPFSYYFSIKWLIPFYPALIAQAASGGEKCMDYVF